jgi:MinD-like ATPase involved in chromosome partitioning or flagellar assembly
MTFKIAVHSFKGGTGKSTITANLAVSLAQEGRRVGVLDLDLAGPGLHVLFEMRPDEMKYTLNDFFIGRCSADSITVDLTDKMNLKRGALVFVPASFKAEDIIRVLSKGYEIGMFREALNLISKMHNLDYMIIDTHPGVEKSTLVSMGVCDMDIIISRMDSQDIFGTGVMLEVTKVLEKPQILIANMIPPGVDKEKVKARLETLFGTKVITAIPFYTEILRALSSEVFVLKNPDHAFSAALRPVIEALELKASQNLS